MTRVGTGARVFCRLPTACWNYWRGHGERTPEAAGVTRTFLPIGGRDYASITEARIGLIQCLSIEEKFDLVVENYLELEDALLHSALKSLVRYRPKSLDSHGGGALLSIGGSRIYRRSRAPSPS